MIQLFQIFMSPKNTLNPAGANPLMGMLLQYIVAHKKIG